MGRDVEGSGEGEAVKELAGGGSFISVVVKGVERPSGSEEGKRPNLPLWFGLSEASACPRS